MESLSLNTAHRSARIVEAVALALGALCLLPRVTPVKYPTALIIAATAASTALVVTWLFVNVGPLRRREFGVLFRRSWPLWFSLLWLHEPFVASARMVLTDIAVCGLLCSISVALADAVVSLRPRFHRPLPWLPWALAGVYASVFWVLPSLRYWSYTSFWMDLGYMLHPLWNSIHGRWFEFMRLEGVIGSGLGDHFSIIYALLLPFYWILPRAETLFLVQSASCALAGLILFFWARKSFQSNWIAIFLQSAFYLWFPLQSALIYDFHAEPLAVPFIMLMLWAYDCDRPARFWVGLLCTLACKEHMGFALAPLLIVLAFRSKWRVQMIVAAGLCVGYSILAHMVFVPHFNFGRESLASQLMFPGGDGGVVGIARAGAAHPQAILRQIFTAWNFEQLCWILGSLLFLPLLAWPEILGLSALLFKEMYGAFSLQNNHQAPFAPILFWCVILVVRRCRPEHRKGLAAGIACACLLFGFVGGESPLSHRLWRTFSGKYLPSAHSRACDAARLLVAKDSSVSSSSHIAVHLCDRREIYLFPRPFLDEHNRPIWRTGMLPLAAPAYVVFDRTHAEIGSEILSIAQGNRSDSQVGDLFEELVASGFYQTIFKDDGITVLRLIGARTQHVTPLNSR